MQETINVTTVFPGIFYLVSVPMGIFVIYRAMYIKWFKNEKINIIDRRN